MKQPKLTKRHMREKTTFPAPPLGVHNSGTCQQPDLSAIWEMAKPKFWHVCNFLLRLAVSGRLKIYMQFLIVLISIHCVSAQEKNFQTTIGLGLGPSIPVGSFRSRDIMAGNNGFASSDYLGLKFILEQNLGKRLGISMNYYYMYHNFDVMSFEWSLNMNNRGLAPDQGLIYKIHETQTEWEVGVGNIGLYYYRNFGKQGKLSMKCIGSVTTTEMYSPTFVVDIKDSSGSTISTRNIEVAQSWREASLLPLFDGFSLEINARYFLTTHLAFMPSVCFINSIGWYEGNSKALINLSQVRYQSFHVRIGLSYTFFYRKK